MGCGKSKLNDSKSAISEEQARQKRLKTLKVTHQDFVTERHTKLTNDYNLIITVGRGAYGEVKKAVHKTSKLTRAVKIINKKATNKEELEKIMNEVQILKTIDHPNVMRIIEFYQDVENLYIISEFYEGGELFDKIAEETSFDELKAANFMKQILSAIAYCHNNRIVHRDMKPENIIFETDKPDSLLKVIDFGTSSYFDPEKKLSKAFGTAYYVAPEVLEKNYNEKCDVWSCGVIMYILLCGKPPFNGNSEKKIIEKVYKGLYEFKDADWEGISEQAKSLIRKMLQKNVGQRYSAQQCLNDPWFDILKEQEKATMSQTKISAVQTLKNLKNFRAEKKLQEAVWIFLSSYFTNNEEKQRLLETFKRIDKDNNGILTRDEIMQGYQEITGKIPNKNELEELMSKIDVNGNGTVDYQEFVTATLNRNTLLSTEKLETAFKLFDKDGNGQLDVDEVKQFFGGQGNADEQIFRDVIHEVDVDKDGQISLVEFKDMMLKMIKK